MRVAAVLCFTLVLGCGSEHRSPFGEAKPSRVVPFFVELGAEAGVDVRFDFEDGVVDTFWKEQPRPRNELIAMIGGACADDWNGDGFLDLFVLGGARGAHWFANDGNGGFRDVTDTIGVPIDAFASGPVFADFDGDGRSDLLLGGIGKVKIQLLRNSDAGFVDVTREAGLSQSFDTVGFGVGDADGDGDLDVVAARWGQLFYPQDDDPALKRSELFWLNDGTGHFSDHSELLRYPLRSTRMSSEGELSEVALTPNFADLDGDGDQDLVLTQDFAMSTVLRNDTRDGQLPSFTDITERAVVNEDNGMGAALSDYDNDGDLDWFVTSISGQAPGYEFYSGNRLYRNDGEGAFHDVTDEAGVRWGSWGWGACFADFDLDGFVDLFQVNGWGYGDPWTQEHAPEFLDDRALLFLSRAAARGSFDEVAAEAGIDDAGQGRGVVCLDYDRDGDVDVFLTNTGGLARLYQNRLDPLRGGAHFLTVFARGPKHGRGIGTRLWLTTDQGTQLRELRIQNNYVSQDPAEAHFGLGSAERVETLRVRFADGSEQVLRDLDVNRVTTVRAR